MRCTCAWPGRRRVAAADKETALAAVAALGERWATSGPSAMWREVGGSGGADTRGPHGATARGPGRRRRRPPDP
ncbi:DUF6207 family protein [Streptomyces sp. BE230]|uniref:DUF6207 family protein n=1 Tax=Streptomyces sp. BE230 TaxID=3002526 RepID=UPI003FA76A5D